MRPHKEPRNAADRFQSADMGRDPVRQALRSGRFGVGETRRAQHRHENQRRTPLTGEAVDDDQHGIACVVPPTASRQRRGSGA